MWIALALWDEQWLRDIFETMVTISFLGPFAGYWVGLGGLFLAAD